MWIRSLCSTNERRKLKEQRLVDAGHAVGMIERDLDAVKTAGWVIDRGPEAGRSGGMVVRAGAPCA